MMPLFILLMNLLFTIINGDVYEIKDSAIEHVTILGGKAEVKRSFEVSKLEDGYHSFRLKGLPQELLENSIVVNLDPTSMNMVKDALTIVGNGLETYTINRRNDPNYQKAIQDLESKLKDVHREIDLVKDQEKKFDQRRTLAESYANGILERKSGAKDEQIVQLSLDKVTEILDFHDVESDRWQKEVAILSKKYQLLSKEAVEIENALAGLKSTGSYKATGCTKESCDKIVSFPDVKIEKELLVNIHVKEGKQIPSAKFQLSYLVNYAYWNPCYDIRVESMVSNRALSGVAWGGQAYSVEIDFFATLSQSTGEDWINVPLTLSTSNPSYSLRGISPQRRIISFQDNQHHYEIRDFAPQRMRTKVAKSLKFDADISANNLAEESFGGGADMEGSAPAMGSAIEEVFQPKAGVIVSDVDFASTYSFDMVHLINVTSESSRPRDVVKQAIATNSKYFIDKLSVDSRFFSYGVPTLSNKLYLRSFGNYSGTGISNSGVPLIASPSSRVFLQGTYVGETDIPSTVLPGNDLKLHLGEDKNTELKMNKILPTNKKYIEDRSTWFTSDKKSFAMNMEEFHFNIKSSYRRPHLVLLSEYYPHAKDAEIKVELVYPGMEGSHQLVQTSEEEMIDVILQHDFVLNGPKGQTEGVAFISQKSNAIIWAVWVLPGHNVHIPFKYRVYWPEGKSVTTMSS